MKLSKALIMAYAVQDLTFKALKSFEAEHSKEDGMLALGEFGAQKLSQLVRAFAEAQERVRICRNKPLPGVLKPEPKRKGKPAPITVLEPLSEEPVTTADVSTIADSP